MTTTKAMNDIVIDALKDEVGADPFIVRIVTEEVIDACSGDQRARRWLQTDGSNWLAAVGKYFEEGGKISYP